MPNFLRITPKGSTTDFFFNPEQIVEVKVDDDKLIVKLSNGEEHNFDRAQVPEPALNKFISTLTHG